MGITIVGVLATGAAGYLLLGPDVGGSSLIFSEWYGTACPVDANGDGVLDFAGRIARPGSSSHRIAVVDGSDGSVLWTSKSDYDFESWLLCFSDETFGVALKDFRLELHASKGGEPKTMVLPDAPLRYGATDECARLDLKDGATVGVRLPSGERGECDAELTHLMTGGPITSGTKDAHRVEHDGTTYCVEPKDRGTPTLTVRAERGEDELWSLPLRHAVVGNTRAALVVTPDMVLTYGAAPADSDKGVLVGIDRASGAMRFESSQRTRWSTNSVSELLYNGQYVVMTWGFGLHAYDPVTGERAWNIGGRT